jgi:hypothetical protein
MIAAVGVAIAVNAEGCIAWAGDASMTVEEQLLAAWEDSG